jgi:hypothetical protein
VNPFNLPNWREREAYGDVSQWRYVRWRWEFRRRYPDYRADAAKVIGAPDPDSRYAAWEAYWQAWGYSEPLDPSISAQPDELLKTWPHRGVRILDGSASSEAGLSALMPRIGEIAVTIDLSRPFAAQMKIIERAFKKRGGGGPDKKHVPKDSGALWLSYLRLLDGIEARQTGLFGTVESDTAIWAHCRALRNTTSASQAKRKARALVSEL